MIFAVKLQEGNMIQGGMVFEDLDKCNEFAKDNAPCYVCEVIGLWRPVAEPVEFVTVPAAIGPGEPEKPKRGRPSKKPETVTTVPEQSELQGSVDLPVTALGRDENALDEAGPSEDDKLIAKQIARCEGGLKEYNAFEDENDLGPGDNPVMDAEEFAIRRCQVPDDVIKCPRCGGPTISALANKDKMTICKNEECYAGSEWLARQAQIAASIPAPVDTSDFNKQRGLSIPEEPPIHHPHAGGCKACFGTGKTEGASHVPCAHCGGSGLDKIPEEAEVVTRVRLLGMEVDSPPSSWSSIPITNESTTDNAESRGQLVALNAALTSIGYGDTLRHSAVGRILCIDPPASLRDLTKAQAHLALEWISKAGPDHLAVLSKAMHTEII